MTGVRIAIALMCVMLGFLIGAWMFGSRHGPETCARVSNGVVCWRGISGKDWIAR